MSNLEALGLEGRLNRMFYPLPNNEPVAGMTILDLSAALAGIRKLDGLTSTWPGNDTFSFKFLESDQVRSFRFKAVKTAGATADAVVKYTYDAPNAAAAKAAFDFVAADPSIVTLPYLELFDDEWSKEIYLFPDQSIYPLQRVDFLPTADTWRIIMEIL